MERWLPPPSRGPAEAFASPFPDEAGLLDPRGVFDRDRAERLAELLRPCWHPDGGTSLPAPPLGESTDASNGPARNTPVTPLPSAPLLVPGLLVAGAAVCGLTVAYASSWVERLGPIEVLERTPAPSPAAPGWSPRAAADVVPAAPEPHPTGTAAAAPPAAAEPEQLPAVVPPPAPRAPAARVPAARPAPPRPTPPKYEPPRPAPPKAELPPTPPPRSQPPKHVPPRPPPPTKPSRAEEAPRAPDIVRKAPF